MIPRVFHQIWLGPSPLPEAFVEYRETWRRHHPEWEHRLWTEESIPDDVRPEITERLRAPAERADMLRLELLARHGGVYTDSDFESLRPLDPLIADVDFFVAEYRRGRVNNAIVGAAPQHPVVLEALSEVHPRERWGYDKDAAGPELLERVVRRHDVRVFERPLFYPDWTERHDAVAYHHMMRSWKDAPGLRSSIGMADRRRLAAERELARLEGRRGPRDPLRRVRRAREEIEGRLQPKAVLLRARLGSRGARPSAIPHVFHTVRLGDSPLPDAHAVNLESWRLAHPDWAWRAWSEANLPQGLRPEVYDPLRSPAERADLLRLELLAREGGVGLDGSLACRGRVDRLLGEHEAVATADASFVASVPGAAAIEHAREHAQPTEWFTASTPRTGAAALAHAVDAGLPLEIVSRAALGGGDAAEELSRLRERLARAEERQHEAEDALASARGAQARGGDQ